MQRDGSSCGHGCRWSTSSGCPYSLRIDNRGQRREPVQRIPTRKNLKIFLRKNPRVFFVTSQSKRTASGTAGNIVRPVSTSPSRQEITYVRGGNCVGGFGARAKSFASGVGEGRARGRQTAGRRPTPRPPPEDRNFSPALLHY